MMDHKNIKDSLSNHRLAPSKRLGQNFLVNQNTSAKIVRLAGVQSTDTIIEVGVGLGSLTYPIAGVAKHVIGVEIDRGIIRYHEQEQKLPENVTLIHQDILKTDFSDLYDRTGERLKIMANLPYSISNPFLFKMIDNRHHIEWATIMLQKEVADRIMATPGSKQYGIPSILLQSCSNIKRRLTLKPDQFHPRPQVDSVVVTITFWPLPSHLHNLPEYDHRLLQTIVRAAFAQRRKTLGNTLAASRLFGDHLNTKSEIRDLTRKTILQADIDPTSRGETLALEHFINLARCFEQALANLKTPGK